jgi:septum site-determining protein MinC
MAVTQTMPVEGRPAAFELKAAGFTLPIIRLLRPDIEAVAAGLGARVEQAPEFFRNTPVVIDLSGFPAGSGEVELPLLVGLLRGYGMIPFGVRGGDKAQHAAAEAMELAILGESEARSHRSDRGAALAEPQSAPGSEPVPGPAPEPMREAPVSPPPPPAEPSRVPERRAETTQTPGESTEARDAEPHVSAFTLITRPVRSGQRVYAPGGDLSVIAAVSAGAELIADGNIHVYGALRGRALAGVKGDTSARIFCQDLQAELVSVAGHYRVSERIPPELRGIPVQIYLDQQVLRIERI